MTPFFILFGILVVLIFGYVGAMQLNAKVDIPESCKEAYLEAQNCGACGTKNKGGSCNFQDTLQFLKEVKLDD